MGREHTERIQGKEMAIHSFERITNADGKIHYPEALGHRYRIVPYAERARAAEALLSQIDSRYEGQYSHSPETYGLGREALKTYLTHFTVPRPTEGEAPMQLSMFEWAYDNRFHCELDSVGNVAIVIPGRKNGQETTETEEVVAFHHHLDNVAIAKEGSGVNPDIESVIPEVWERDDNHADGELWLRAQKGLRSAGLDNGAGGAILWQIAKELGEDQNDHPTIVILGTVGEEGKMDGAKGVSFDKDPNSVVAPLLKRATRLVNNDMELDKPEPAIIVGSFGLETFSINQPVTTESFSDDYTAVTISLAELKGGHSGLYPDRAHAGKIAIEQLVQALGKPSEENPWRLCSFSAGKKHNEIAANAQVTIALPRSITPEKLQETLANNLQDIRKQYDEPALEITVQTPEENPSVMLSQESTDHTTAFLLGLARLHGSKGHFIYKPTREDLYARALNMGVVRVDKTGIAVDTSSRIGIAVDGKNEAFGEYFEELAQLPGCIKDETLHKNEEVPTWRLTDLSLAETAQQAYQAISSSLPDGSAYPALIQSVVTAGLEVSVFQDLFARAQSLVFGMYITDIHKPGEALQIPSFFLNAMLVKTYVKLLFQHLEANRNPTQIAA